LVKGKGLGGGGKGTAPKARLAYPNPEIQRKSEWKKKKNAPGGKGKVPPNPLCAKGVKRARIKNYIRTCTKGCLGGGIEAVGEGKGAQRKDPGEEKCGREKYRKKEKNCRPPKRANSGDPMVARIIKKEKKRTGKKRRRGLETRWWGAGGRGS